MPVLIPDPWVDVPTTPTYVTVGQLRALPNLTDPAKFTDIDLAVAAVWFETLFEDYTGVAWTPRTVTGERHYGQSGQLILDHLYPRTITAVNAWTDADTSTAYTAGELADLRVDQSGLVVRNTLGSFTSGYGLVTVDYSHGWTEPPADVIEACKTAVRAHLLDDYQANRQYAVQSEQGIIRTSQPGPDRPFGLPEVDVIANRRCHRSPACA